MSDFISEVLIIFFEVFLCKMFCEIFGNRRRKCWTDGIWFMLTGLCVFVAARKLSGFFAIKEAVMVSIFAVFMFQYAKIRIGKAFILALLYQAMLLSTEYLAYSANNRFHLENEAEGRQYSIESILVILLGKAIVFLCILVIKKRLGGKPTDLLSDTDWLRIMVFPVFTIITIVAMLSVFRYIETSGQVMLLSVSAFGMLGMNIVVFYIINDIVERKEQTYEDRILRIQAENQAGLYRSASEHFNRQKKKTHEYKNQIVCMQALLKERQYEKLEEYIKELYGGLDSEMDTIDTNNVIINAVLNAKYREAEASGIVLLIKVGDLSGLIMADQDIVALLCNLLDNAIEACGKCGERKVIKLKIAIEDGMVKIGIKNTFQNLLVYENGEIKTTKTVRKEEHGLGIKNIAEVTKKYGGSYVIKDEDGEFCFSIVIPV